MKKSDQDQNAKRLNRWLCTIPFEVPTDMHTKFLSSVMASAIVSNARRPDSVSTRLQVDAAVYVDVLDIIVKLWI